MSCLAGKTLPAPRTGPSRERSCVKPSAVACRAGAGPWLETAASASRSVGDRAQVRVQVAAQDVSQQRPQVLGELVDERVDARARRGASPRDHRALQRDRVRSALGQRGSVLGRGADRRQPPGEPPARRSLGLEQRPQRQQVVGQRLERRQPLAAHLEPRQRPGDLAAARVRAARSGCRTPAARPRARPR